MADSLCILLLTVTQTCDVAVSPSPSTSHTTLLFFLEDMHKPSLSIHSTVSTAPTMNQMQCYCTHIHSQSGNTQMQIHTVSLCACQQIPAAKLMFQRDCFCSLLPCFILLPVCASPFCHLCTKKKCVKVCAQGFSMNDVCTKCVKSV